MTVSSAPPPVPAAPQTSPEREDLTRRSKGDGRAGLRGVVLLIALLAVLPVGLVAATVLTPDVDIWKFLWDTGLGRMVTSTVTLLVGVIALTLVIGGGLAWLVGRYRFPGQRVFSWLLVLPFAVPAYVLGFVYVGLLDHPGPVQTWLRSTFGVDVWFPEIRSMPFAIITLSLAFYPYVYLLARAALREQSASTYEAARVLGRGPLRTALNVVLPLARPSLAAGAALVAMETLTDYATVQYFNVETVSVGIDRVWNGMYNRDAATELASLVLLFALTVIGLERAARGRARYHQQGGSQRSVPPTRLTGWRAGAATATCLLVVGVTFVIPVVQLIFWSSTAALRNGQGLDPRYLSYLGNSTLVAALTAAACVVVALVVASATRLGGGTATRRFARLATVGYAVPGPVVAIGVLVMLAALRSVMDAAGIPGGRVLVTGTLFGLIYAYVVRFLALSVNSIDASLEKVTPSMTSAALTLGAKPSAVVRRVHLPLVRSGVGVALVLVAVDALKELPVVLLLRPFGFETLAIWVYQLASESRWETAGLPALTIVAVALVPVVLLFRRTLTDEDEGRKS
ncbi:MAG TPA: iron ABC transporter permease [Actinomycetales bacterium]|nr:iron ABC transporter permease [Actinomycetales bacterium]